MPMSGRGSERAARSAGFTLIELLVVVAIIAMTAGLVSVALRDGTSLQLEREAQRLALLLETARAESRASGMPVWWQPGDEGDAAGFRFVGLPPSLALPTAWLDADTRAEVLDGNAVSLGPEALIGPQRVALRLGEQRVVIATDGLVPFDTVVGVGQP